MTFYIPLAFFLDLNAFKIGIYMAFYDFFFVICDVSDGVFLSKTYIVVNMLTMVYIHEYFWLSRP